MRASPSGWAVVPFAEVLREPLRNGHSAKAAAHGKIRTLTLTAVTTGDFSEGNTKLTDADPEKVNDLWLEPGDLLVERSNTPELVGTTRVFRGRRNFAIFPDLVIRARVAPGVLPEFAGLAFATTTARRYFQGSAQGIAGSMPKISQETIETFLFAVPPTAEQRRIVGEIEQQFTRLDAGVAALRRVQVQLKRYRVSALQAACEGRLLDGAEVTDRFSGEGPRPLPIGWRWSHAGEFLRRIEAGKSFKCEERPPHSGEVGVVKVSAVTWGEYDEAESKTCMDPDRVDDSLFVRPGDFLFSRANTIDLVGACVIARRVTKRVMLSDKILRFDLCGVDPAWLLYVLRSKWGRREIERLATGNQESMRNIGQERIRSIRVPIPPLAEQHRIVAEVERRLSVVDELERLVEKNLVRAAKLRQAILKRAFEGRLVPQDPNDEPASVLLDRIRAERDARDTAVASGRTEKRSARVPARRPAAKK